MVVVAIIGILAAGSVALYSGSQEKARDSVRVSDLQGLSSALNQYYSDNTYFPGSESSDASTAKTINNSSTGLVAGGYINQLPTDPKNSVTEYNYWYDTAKSAGGIDDQKFEVSAQFENATNRTEKAAKDGGNDASGASSADIRLEVGTGVSSIDTTGATVSSDKEIIIKGSSTAATT